MTHHYDALLDGEGMEVDSNSTSKTSITVSTTDIPVKEEPMDTVEEKPQTKEPEKKYEIINNPCRALNQQLRVLSFTKEQTRYSPLKPLTTGGIILLRDARPEEAEVTHVTCHIPLLDIDTNI